jgi:DNA repair exonuclease SbcCD ATPase subunit
LLFIRRDSDVWDSLWSQRAALAEANERLTQRSTEVADLRLLCDELKSEAVAAQAEASLAREQVASQAEEMQQRQLELGQTVRERDQSWSQVAEAVSRAEALGGQLDEAAERLAEASARAETLAEDLTTAVESARSAQAVASQQRARAKGRFCPLCNFDLTSLFILRLKNVVLLFAGFETALNESVKNYKALAEAAEWKEAERVAMSEAVSAFCQAFGLDGVPSCSSP